MICRRRTFRQLFCLSRLLALLAAGMGSSCILLDMLPLTITSFSPQESLLSSVEGVQIRIEFSRPVNPLLTEQAFSITADTSALPGRLVWEDARSFTFVPDEPLSESVVYQMSVSQAAEDTEGKDLAEEFNHTFTTKSDYSRPTVLSTSPTDHQTISDLFAPVTVSFSEPMDPASLRAGFSLLPSATGFLTVSQDAASLTFTPTQALEWQTTYTMTIAESAADAQRNTLGTAFTSHFSVGTDTTPPSVSSVKSADGSLTMAPDDPSDSVLSVTSGWESTQGVVVTFSEPVLTTSALSAIQVEPTVQSEVKETNAEFTTTLTYSFPDRLAYGITYTLTAGAGVQDMQGNRTTGMAVYHFSVDGPLTAPPVVTRVAYAGVSVTPAVPANNVLLSPYDSITLPLVTDGTRDTFFDVYVDLAQGASIDPLAVAGAFSASTTNNAASLVPFAVEIGPAVTNPAPSAAANEVVARVWVHVTNNAASGQVVLHVSTSVEDSRKTPMAAEFLLPLNDPQ